MIIQVENIKCNGCATTIKKNLSTIENIESIVVNVEQENISYTGKEDRDKIVNLLAKLGYPEKGNNNLIHKAKSFVSCAKGKLA